MGRRLLGRSPLAEFTSRAAGPVNVLKTARARSLAELADLGVARVSYASLLHHQAMQQFTDLLASLGADLVRDGD